MLPADLTGAFQVYVNGCFASNLSDDLPAGITSCALAEQADVGRLAQKAMVHEGESLLALGQAALQEGVAYHVEATTETPVVIVHITTQGGWAGFTHHVISSAPGVEASFIECHVSSCESSDALLNNTVEIIVADNAVIRHALVDMSATGQTQLHTALIEIGAKAQFHGQRILLGGGMIRSSVQPTIIGSKATCEVDGIYVPIDGQVYDNHMRMNHAATDCWSRQKFKGLARKNGRGIFTGRIVVDQIAQQTDAVQECRSMLLDDTGRLLSRPQLEIYADDVKCTHGATTGEVDEDQLFYLISRGIPKEQAMLYLIDAFVGDVIDTLPECIQQWAMGAARAKLR